MLSTLALYPIIVLRLGPENKSPMRVIFNEPNDETPIPWKNRRIKSTCQSFVKKHASPATAKRSSDGIKMVFRPHRSAKIPASGDKNIPGKVKTVMSNVTWLGVMSNCSLMDGNAGVILATPITATSVTKKMVARFLFSIIAFYGKQKYDFQLRKRVLVFFFQGV